MTQDKDDRKRPQLRLVVNNPELRGSRPATGEDASIPFEVLIAKRHELRADFFKGIAPQHVKAYERIERHLERRGWLYGLDPQHGRLMVIPAATACPEVLEHGGSPQDELLLFVADDPTGLGLCLCLEIILPFWSDDDAVMEEALIYAPIYPYGSLFLEENRNDGYLDLIYRLSFPLYPPAPTERLLEKLFAVARYELRETLIGLDEFPEA
ncbi:hypothetical protein GeomeDRAFT_2697 [Geobacter metallireducens RCH3]|uniref:Uncharacterized protein n=1 Tax=Geobacter metallireducens (strain ATCC 53774 / DSM 7210 / GS-15) TaxID=269799 RepID=Q39XU6_GEOMG|nr:hypothetical protein [Geobacter metallireducens]ABB30928.1 hypothetical protein Gmet_0686 [Geobacter metallireducens GS-15]EHP85091.1 hypothetical protein GeomeDRAFT_2697 [Geobacter metallireducens RCH3]